MPRTLKVLLFALLGLLQCESDSANLPTAEPIRPEFRPVAARPVEPSLQEQAAQQCEILLRATLARPAVPGAATFEARRLEILTRAKAEPVLLTGTPAFVDPPELPALAVGQRRLLANSKHPYGTLQMLLPHFTLQPALGRAVLLRDGYLFSDNPEMAYAMVNLVTAEHLFGHDRIWIRRGEQLLHASRKDGRYVFDDGPNEGERVRLLLFDRLGYGEVPSDTLVRDFRSLRYRLNFDRANVRHVTESHIVVDLKYGHLTVPSVLRSQGARLELECEIVHPTQVANLAEARAHAGQRQDVVQALRASMRAAIADQLPFDEPRREYGFQLDGKLRKNWQHAYFEGKSDYALNGDRYPVFSPNGNPAVPQVCVDFLTDTFEHLSGSWWTPKGQAPKRIVGKLNFDVMNTLERAKLRRVPGFLAYAAEHPEQFEVLDVPPPQRIALGRRAELLEYLTNNVTDFQPGDIIVIRGRTPWDAREMHYHSFFVYESDPLSGIPLALVGNAGRPSVRYWEVEARRTPEREIWNRVRPRTRWLQSLMAEGTQVTDDPAPLSPLGNSG
jgi:hypothetical protein